VKRTLAYFLIPVIGYLGLWILGTVLFLLYFALFHISFTLGNTEMIKQVPPVLSITTVALCSFISFFITGRIIFKITDGQRTMKKVILIAVVSFFSTILFDVLITAVIEKIDILAFPMNVMYGLAWIAVIPAVLLSGPVGRRTQMSSVP
jgi:hypothetical protein